MSVKLEKFLDMNKNSNIQDIIVNLFKLNKADRNNLLIDKNGVLEDKICCLLQNSKFEKYILLLNNFSLLDFFDRFGKDFILSLDIKSQYDLINSDIPVDSLVDIIPCCCNEVVNYFFENDKRAVYLIERFNILPLISKEIKFNDNILKKKEFFEMLKSVSFINFRKNINAVEKNNNPIFIEKHLEKYYEEIISQYNSDTGMFREYYDILNNIDILFDESVKDNYIVNEDIKEKARKYVEYDSDYNLIISDMEAIILLFKDETSKKISEVVIDVIFKDNIYNVWLNIKEMLRYNEMLSEDEKILDENKIKFYNLILKFDNVSVNDKIMLYNKMKTSNFSLEFYNNLRKTKNFAYDKIKEEMFNVSTNSELISSEYSNKYGVSVYDVRDKEYVMLVRVLSTPFNSVGYHNKDCYSIISNEDNYVIKQGSSGVIVYGYSSFDNDKILHMFESDAFSLLNMDNKFVNRIMSSRELVTSNGSYNEIQILNKKKDSGKYLYDILRPDYIVSYDSIKENEILESKRLNIPIVLISKVRMKDADNRHNSFDVLLDSYDRDEDIKRSTR